MSVLWGNPVANGINSFLGNAADKIGTSLNLPEFGLSEALAGGRTQNTGRVGVLGTSIGQAQQPTSSNQQGFIGPLAANQVQGPPNAAGQSAGYTQGTGDSRLTQLQKMAASGGLNPTERTELESLMGQQDPNAGIRNEISAAWDSYLNSLNDTSSYINNQRTAQEGIANSQLEQGINTANEQKSKSLRDIANTTRNAFQAGNNYLGSLGAGDSSAANQYSFAINQQANKQTGDLNNFVVSQIQGLQSQHDQQINQIASWFAQQQEALKQQIATGQLQKGQDLANLSKSILDQAMQATNALKANTQNQYNALLQWATNNSQNFGQLQQNIASIPQAMGQLSIGSAGVGARPQYGGAPATQKTDMFGRPIQA